MQPDITQRTDEELIQQAGQGDQQAFGVLYERYLDAIYRYMFYRVANSEDAEDLTEKVFLNIWEKVPKLRGENLVRNFRAWLYRISHNVVVDHYRKGQHGTSLELQEGTLAAEGSLDAEIELRDDRNRLAQGISQLDPILQEIIVARFINQLSHAETAAIVGKSQGHVRVSNTGH